MSFDLDAFLEASRRCVDSALERALPAPTEPPAVLHEAMRYAVFSGGKRLRPALAFGAARACGVADEAALPVAVAAELVHAYSLVHDDLPAMDDAERRRGRPCVHVKFGEANAVLVGDALLPAAFGVLAEGGTPLGVVEALARAAGSAALVGGQVDDLALSPETATLDEVVSIHERKTAALFEFAVAGAARTAGAPDASCRALSRFALHYGLAFQATDDLLDADTSECSILGVLPPEAARSYADNHIERARAALEPFDTRADALRALAERVAGRLS
ncbi:MAG: polyprenyl synthetase family protein [Deltaproteobacteria bacterium]|nr:polyprenyl synthetase family protein [Deltaproteobacteria bacterium]MBW2415001.1 polyprenyl synthetase family protein [Deltaproteobacteria bacterium]